MLSSFASIHMFIRRNMLIRLLCIQDKRKWWNFTHVAYFSQISAFFETFCLLFMSIRLPACQLPASISNFWCVSRMLSTVCALSIFQMQNNDRISYGANFHPDIIITKHLNTCVVSDCSDAPSSNLWNVQYENLFIWRNSVGENETRKKRTQKKWVQGEIKIC